MHVHVLGASGFLGSYVYGYFKSIQGINLSGSSSIPRENLLRIDITDQESVIDNMETLRPDCVVNCAALTNVEECEKNQKRADLVNAQGPRNIAIACDRIRARLIHISTDSVFDGSTGRYYENDEPKPVNVYAISKLAGERYVSSHAEDFAIVRTNFYGLNPAGKHLLNWILSNLVKGKEMTGFDDVVFNPLWVGDLAPLIAELAGSSFRKVIHCSGDEMFTKYEFITEVARTLGYTNAKIHRGSFDQAQLLTRRPKNTVLSNILMHKILKTKIRTFEEVFHDNSFDIYRAKRTEKV